MAGLVNITNMNHICEYFPFIEYYGIEVNICKSSMINSAHFKNGRTELLLIPYKYIITYSDDTLMIKS